MSSQVLDWGSFWPGIGPVLSFDFTTTEGVTASFIGLIIVIFLGFLIPSVLMGVCYYRRVKFYLSGLTDVTEDNVINKRQGLIEREEEGIANSSKWMRVVAGSIWKEFDETLIEYDGKLYNNIDAEHFFNGTTLARRIANSRLFPTGAAILTGVGVLGTFLGLQLGLTGLNLDGDVAKIQGEIRLLAQSASVAFVTSVWGVGSSIVLNFLEKWLHGIIMRHINTLQSRVDDIFPRFPVMGVFADIRSNGRESCETLGSLAEQIGNRMQESMDSFSKEMAGSIAENMSKAASDISTAIGTTLKDTIEESLVPSIEEMAQVSKELANKQAKGSEEAMANLLEQFMAEMGREGEGQRNAMHTAAEEIRDAMNGLTGSMSDFFISLKEQQAALSKEQDERSKTLEDSVKNLVAHQGDALEQTNQKIADMLQTFATAMGQEQSRQAESLSSASGDVREAISEMSDGMRTFFDALEGRQESMMAEQDERTRALESVVQSLLNQQNETQNEANQQVAKMLHDFLEGMGSAQEKQAGSLGEASETVQEALLDMGGQLNTFLQTLNSSQTSLTEEQDNRHQVLTKQINDIMEQQSVALEYVDNTIENHVKATNSLLEQGAALQNHIDGSRSAMDSTVARMNKTSDAFATATSNLKMLGAEIGQSVKHASESIAESTSLANSLFSENATVARNIEKTLASLQDVRTSVENTIQTLDHATSDTKNGFTELAAHYADLQETMETHVEELDTQVTRLLKDYGEYVSSQVNDRMSQWDSQTKNFCSSIKQAVEAIGEVVENIEMRAPRA
ncbi:anti-phage ZorAB system protein ZorA [Desulfobaculum sp. SPO524]|uniref:anti-phage ZorAB system protein ZorA n=1 Tax=Desulfobaculum sp. SPO524 TaxID=3378071 RepID=UPI0038546E51